MNRGWSIPDVYLTRVWDLDSCPECGGPKTKHGVFCIACRRRLGRPTRPVADRFWEKVDMSAGPDGCWPWAGATTPLGYGVFRVESNRNIAAHRYSLILAIGALPSRTGALHRCDNPPCVNPAHLFAGTQQDNIRDMIAKGRASWQRAS